MAISIVLQLQADAANPKVPVPTRCGRVMTISAPIKRIQLAGANAEAMIVPIARPAPIPK